MIKIHIILNSHLDPAWFWNKEQGMDEVIATARTACSVLDDYPEIFITRGEAWFYETLSAGDPETYARVKQYVASGRWQVVGNWYVQPDCNQPSAESFRRQYELSIPVWRDLGVRPTVGYNVDSFGHAATLPDFYRECGVDSYIMNRPDKNEMALPSRLFKWESPHGNQVTVFRIIRYATRRPGHTERNIREAVAEADPRIGHIACMIGLGNHGGGPTRQEIEYLLAHRHYAPGVELVFSHPRAFFDAVKPFSDLLPVVRGELQPHAIGCYSVMRKTKSSHRRCEELMEQFENVAADAPDFPGDEIESIRTRCGKNIAFNEFHDIMGGCSLQEVQDQAQAELDGTAAELRNRTAAMLRRKLTALLPPDPDQRAVFYNTAKRPFRGMVEFEPWLASIRLIHVNPDILDESGLKLKYQKLPARTPDTRVTRYTLPLEIPAGGWRVLRLHHQRQENPIQMPVPPPVITTDEERKQQRIFEKEFAAGFFVDPHVGEDISAEVEAALAPIKLGMEIIPDAGDTWSHGFYGYSAAAEYRHRIDGGKFLRIASGEFCTLALQEWSCPVADVALELRTFRNDSSIRLRFRINWRGKQQIMKLRIAPDFGVNGALFGCPNGEIDRPADGREFPFYNFARLSDAGSGGRSLTVVSRDVYGGDLLPDGTLRLTMLRSPYYAHHTPFVIPECTMHPVCDQGMHEMEITLLPGASTEQAADEILRQQQPVYFLESTRGCARDYLYL